jgi:hypothetical protein
LAQQTSTLVQTDPYYTQWRFAVDSMLQHVDTDQVPSAILYDRVLPLAGLPYFDRFQADTTSVEHLRQAYLELYMSSYYPDATSFRLSPDELREKSEALTRQNLVPLAVLDYRLHYLDTLAVHQNQLRVQNGLYYDVVGRNGSPYTERLLTLVAPLTRTVKQSARFILDPAFWLGNRGRTVSQVVVDFGNGTGPNPYYSGQTVPVSYPTPGEKLLRFTVYFTNGTQATSRARLTVTAQTANRGTTGTGLVVRMSDMEARDPFKNYINATSLYGKGEVLAVLHHPTSKAEDISFRLRNPVIIMDGFDPNDESKLNIDDFGNKSLLTQLDEAGILGGLELQQRDLIILNFPKSKRRQVGGGETTDDIDGGTDYVERNAYVLETLLNNLKGRLATDPATNQPYKYTVIGPSMGGLISRYALAHMEQQQQLRTDAGQLADPWWDHNTDLWVSLDVPHTGANIPLGDQFLLDFFRNVQAARDNLEQRLDAVAAKQFLVAHYSTGSVNGAAGFRDRFMLALRNNGERNSFGYPVRLRRVALANGKLNGGLPPPAEGVPGGPMLDLNIYTRFWNGVGVTLISFFGFTYRTVENRIAYSTIRFLGNPGQSPTIFEGVSNQTSGLNWGRLGPIAKKSMFPPSGPQGSWDLAPGGLRDTQRQLHDQFEMAGKGQKFKVHVRNVKPNHCFIPTVSALGYQYQGSSNYQNTSVLPNPFENLTTRNLVCTGETPFDAYYAPTATNTFHVKPDLDGLQFLGRELARVVATPVFTAAPGVMCPNTSATFTVLTECVRPGQPGITYTWTAVDGLAIEIGQGTNSIRVRALPGFSGVAALQVVASRSGSVSAPASAYPTVSNGYVNTELDLQGAQKVCPYTSVIVRVTGFGVQAPYTWTQTTYLNGQPFTSSFTTQQPEYTVSVGEESVDLTVAGHSTCDGQLLPATSRTITPYVDPNGGFYCDPYSYRVAPNPADDYVEIATRPGNSPLIKPMPAHANPHAFKAHLHNDRGEVVATGSTKDGLLRLNTANLRPGLYHLILTRGNKTVSRNLSVQH